MTGVFHTTESMQSLNRKYYVSRHSQEKKKNCDIRNVKVTRHTLFCLRPSFIAKLSMGECLYTII